MFAITGVSGPVGGAAARELLDAGHAVRAVLRDESNEPVIGPTAGVTRRHACNSIQAPRRVLR